MKLAALTVGIWLVGSTATAQEQRIRADVTVRPANGPDFGQFVTPMPTSSGLGPANEAIKARRERAAQQPQVVMPQALPAPAPADNAVMEIASWPDAGQRFVAAGAGELLWKIDVASVRAFGSIRVLRWGVLYQGQGFIKTALVDCAAQTVDPAWPYSKPSIPAPGSGERVIYSRACPPPAMSTK